MTQALSYFNSSPSGRNLAPSVWYRTANASGIGAAELSLRTRQVWYQAGAPNCSYPSYNITRRFDQSRSGTTAWVQRRSKFGSASNSWVQLQFTPSEYVNSKVQGHLGDSIDLEVMVRYHRSSGELLIDTLEVKDKGAA